jgi:hypothetical protein
MSGSEQTAVVDFPALPEMQKGSKLSVTITSCSCRERHTPGDRRCRVTPGFFGDRCQYMNLSQNSLFKADTSVRPVAESGILG